MKRPDCFRAGHDDVIKVCKNSCEYVDECSNDDEYSSTHFENQKVMIETSIGNFNTEAEAIKAFEEKIKPKERPKSKLLFILTMPNVGSWNGKWTGENRVYARVRNAKQSPNCKEDNYYYSFGDGWGANVEVRKVTVIEANKYIKKSVGFSGYDWMIDSILGYGQILNSTEIKEYWKDKLKESKNGN